MNEKDAHAEELQRLTERARKNVETIAKAIERDEFGALPASGIGTAVHAKAVTYTGFLFQEHDSVRQRAAKGDYTKTTMLDWSWSTVPWYARALGLLRLPYDLVKFIFTGRLILIPWPWRW